MRYIASLDGGGTKLCCLIADERGRLVGRAIAGSTNSQFDTVFEIRSAIRSGVAEALDSAGIAASDLSAIYTAMPVLQVEIVEGALDTIVGGIRPSISWTNLRSPCSAPSRRGTGVSRWRAPGRLPACAIKKAFRPSAVGAP